MKDNLFPPTDLALSALLDDLDASGQLDDTLVVVAGEFGRTPKITLLPAHYKLPGRDHWGAVQSVLFAGGGVRGGMSSDAQMQLALTRPINRYRLKILPRPFIMLWEYPSQPSGTMHRNVRIKSTMVNRSPACWVEVAAVRTLRKCLPTECITI